MPATGQTAATSAPKPGLPAAGGIPVAAPGTNASSNVTKGKLFVWLLVALAVGAVAAGLRYASENGSLSLGAITGRLRRRSPIA
jgi:hypothetical protein